MKAKANRLITHNLQSREFEEVMKEYRKRIKAEGDKPYVTVKEQLKLLEDLSKFDVGRFILEHRGLNGYQIHYLLTMPKYLRSYNHSALNELELFLLEKAPTILATQERFAIFLKENQDSVKEGVHLACVPCGVMAELLHLDYSKVKDFQLTGMDYDGLSFDKVKQLGSSRGLISHINFMRLDAWDMGLNSEFDLISSNGLTIYEPDGNRIKELYKKFYEAIKPGGRLVTSFLTYPPTFPDLCEWRMHRINQEDLQKQDIVFTDILNVKWQCYRTTDEILGYLKEAGFVDIQLIPDRANIFPTVVAFKNS